MEIVGHARHPGRWQRADLLRLHRNHIVLMLQDPLDEQERLLDQHQAVARESVRRDDHVGDAGALVLRGLATCGWLCPPRRRDASLSPAVRGERLARATVP